MVCVAVVVPCLVVPGPSEEAFRGAAAGAGAFRAEVLPSVVEAAAAAPLPCRVADRT